MSASKVSPKCEVCLEDMVEPRSLPCGHMFCINCLQQLIDKANNVTCPNDRKLFIVPSGKAADLARNFYLEDLLETLRSSQTSPNATCAEHVDKQAEIFCESCLKSLCCKCVLKHRAHDCFEYSESHDKCEQRVQQLLADVSKFQQAVDEEKTAKSRAVEAQFTACKRKVYAAVKKIHDIVQVLNATAEFLRNTTGQCEQLLLGTFKLASLDELQQEVAELSEAASSLSGDGLKLECRFEQVAELTQKLESRQGKLVKESIPELSRWFADCQLTRSLEKILQHATKLRQNLTNDTKDYLSLQQLSTALNAVNTAVMAEAQSATSRAAALPTSRTPSVVSPAASNAAIAVNRPVMSTVAQGRQKHLLILAGGWDNTSSMAYDTSQDTWRQVAPLTCARWGLAATLWHGKMVVAGGWNNSTKEYLNLVEQYCPETNCWTALPNLLHSRRWLALVCFEQSLFAIGGFNSYSYLNSVEQYALDTQQWKRAASLNTPREGICCGVLQVGILAAGGYDGSKRLNTCELFNCTTLKWQFAGSLVTARDGASAATLNEKAYIFGGLDDKIASDSVEEFDSAADKWTLLPVRLCVSRWQLAAATVNGRVYVCGGFSNGEPVQSFESFDPCEMRIGRFAALPKAIRGAAAVGVPVSDDLYRQLFGK